MIVGINGKISSGKDTVGSIIQYLLCNNVGSITLEDITSSEDHNWWLEEQSSFETKKFAGKLKAMASLLVGVPVEKFEDQDFKKLNMNPEWGMTYREFLQKLGTEAMRDGLHTNVWVNALFADYRPTDSNWNDSLLKHKKEDMFYPNWIITDMRFPNEMKAVVEKGGITIRVVRPGTVTVDHLSETALDDAKFNYEIVNDGSIKDLVEKVKEILITEKLI